MKASPNTSALQLLSLRADAATSDLKRLSNEMSEIAQELKKLRPEEGAQRGRNPKNDIAAMTKEIQDSYAVLLSVFKWLYVRQTPLDSVPEERD